MSAAMLSNKLSCILSIDLQGRKVMTTATMPTHTFTADHYVLNDALLERFHDRAPAYDRDNRFFYEDFQELREAGYLTIAVPKELGGAGMTLAEVSRQQRRLA